MSSARGMNSSISNIRSGMNGDCVVRAGSNGSWCGNGSERGVGTGVGVGVGVQFDAIHGLVYLEVIVVTEWWWCINTWRKE